MYVYDTLAPTAVAPFPKFHWYDVMYPSESEPFAEKLTNNGVFPEVGAAEILTDGA